MGMANGIIVEVDSQSGAFGKSITLPGEGNTIAVWKLGFEGSYLWVQAILFKKNGSSASTMLFYLFAIFAAASYYRLLFFLTPIVEILKKSIKFPAIIFLNSILRFSRIS